MAQPVFLIISLLALLPDALRAASSVDVVSTDYMPPPWLDKQAVCHPHRSTAYSFSADTAICDPSALLSEKQVSGLDSILADIYHGTRPYSLVKCESAPDPANPTGFRVAVAIVRRMSFDGRTLSKRAENFANSLFENWSLHQNCGASALLFLSLEDKRMYIRTGLLATTYLTEHQIDDVYSRMIPELTKNRVSRALSAGVSRIAHYIAKYKGKHAGARSTDEEPTGASLPLIFRPGPAWWDLELSIVAIIFAVFLVFACCNGKGGAEVARKKREKRHVMRKLNIIRTEYISAALPQYIPLTCPYCLGDLTPSWEPTVPVVPPPGEHTPLSSEPIDEAPVKPVRTLRCGHAFHEACFDDNHFTSSDSIPECPVCSDRGGGSSTPPSPQSTRQKDATFRLKYLQEEYPHILTEDVIAKLNSEPPSSWPDSMTEAYLNTTRPQERSWSDSNQGGMGFLGGWGGVLAAGGLGALLASAFSGWGSRGGEGSSSYSGVLGGGIGNHVGQWGSDVESAGGGGHGAGWGSSLSQAAQRLSGNDSSSGGGGGHGSGWGNALGDAASRLTGGGAGWGAGGGESGGGGGGGHGTGW